MGEILIVRIDTRNGLRIGMGPDYPKVGDFLSIGGDVVSVEADGVTLALTSGQTDRDAPTDDEIDAGKELDESIAAHEARLAQQDVEADTRKRWAQWTGQSGR